MMRYLTWPAYLVAFLVFTVPLLDFAFSLGSFAPSQVAWRFGALGLLSRALVTPFIGMLIAYAVALLLEHRVVVRVLALGNAFILLVLLATTGMFVLDALQMRSQVIPEAKGVFDLASVVGLAKYVLASFTALVFASAGWKASSGTSRARARKRHAESYPAILIGETTDPMTSAANG